MADRLKLTGLNNSVAIVGGLTIALGAAWWMDRRRGSSNGSRAVLDLDALLAQIEGRPPAKQRPTGFVQQPVAQGESGTPGESSLIHWVGDAFTRPIRAQKTGKQHEYGQREFWEGYIEKSKGDRGGFQVHTRFGGFGTRGDRKSYRFKDKGAAEKKLGELAAEILASPKYVRRY